MIPECRSSVTQRRTDSNRRFRRLGAAVASISHKCEVKNSEEVGERARGDVREAASCEDHTGENIEELKVRINNNKL